MFKSRKTSNISSDISASPPERLQALPDISIDNLCAFESRPASPSIWLVINRVNLLLNHGTHLLLELFVLLCFDSEIIRWQINWFLNSWFANLMDNWKRYLELWLLHTFQNMAHHANLPLNFILFVFMFLITTLHFAKFFSLVLADLAWSVVALSLPKTFAHWSNFRQVYDEVAFLRTRCVHLQLTAACAKHSWNLSVGRETVCHQILRFEAPSLIVFVHYLNIWLLNLRIWQRWEI